MDQKSYEAIQTFNVPIKHGKIEILYITCSKDETKIGVALGTKLIRGGTKINEIAIYKKNTSTKRFELEKLRDFEMENACQQFYFNIKNNNELLFFTGKIVFKFHYNDESKDIQKIYDIQEKFDERPQIGVWNKTQTKFILTSEQNILYVDMEKQ